MNKKYSRAVYPSVCDEKIKSAAHLLADRLGISAVADTEAEREGEILVGNTARGASGEAARALAGTGKAAAYAIVVSGGAAIVGTCAEATVYGVKVFLDTVSAGKEAESTAYATDNEITVFDDLTVLETGKPTTVFAPEGTGVSYPKLIRLEHNGAENGTLLATQQSRRGNKIGFDILRSDDGGDTWQQIAALNDKTHRGMYANWQPYLYELPERIGDMPEGTLLLAGCTHDWGDSNGYTVKTYICLWRSLDTGLTWEHLSDVDASCYAAGHNGVWEPVLTVDNGRLLCIYSEENLREKYSQRLIYKYSYEGRVWSEAVNIVALSEPALRPGMVSFVKMNNGRYMAMHEIVGLRGGPIHFRTFGGFNDLGNVTARGTKLVSTDGKALGTSPWIGYAPSNGACGMLFAIAEHMCNAETGDFTGEELRLFASLDYGVTWFTLANPMPFTHASFKDAEGNVKHRTGAQGYSSCFFTANDGHTVYFAQSTDYEYKKGTACNRSAIKLVKLKVW